MESSGQSSTFLSGTKISRNLDNIDDSVTRWLDYFSIFGHLHQEKVAQKQNNSAKVGSKLGRILNKHSTIFQRFINILPKWWNFAKSGYTD